MGNYSIKISDKQRLLIIEALNAISEPAFEQLSDSFEELALDDSLWDLAKEAK